MHLRRARTRKPPLRRRTRRTRRTRRSRARGSRRKVSRRRRTSGRQRGGGDSGARDGWIEGITVTSFKTTESDTPFHVPKSFAPNMGMTEYQLTIMINGTDSPTTKWIRWSGVKARDKALKKMIKKNSLRIDIFPTFPSKNMPDMLDPDEIQRRKTLLNTYFTELLAWSIANQINLRTFFTWDVTETGTETETETQLNPAAKRRG